ncbi:MAG TPA: N-acetyl-gamma-glutamyl-phosphate reductase [Bradyrhizobium sp.]|uniref:N-acetyl-gamma-glutamyl-phosphate reductase n=1 Tax=Bradyrhizobium sp. TaxID=376 RepID=UPI002CCD226A|nr:N-acetyl-gamma-glutamyl-phosphate reductase [Bradyrhizobium sp.]HLZ03344.1 N-acetyl-gamma-glutamyl-phosphate reductase [Bradyrhizobium sp.]
MAPKIFIDGEAGTTGLQILQRLSGRGDIELVSIDPARRKEAAARKEIINRADVVILCLPDDAAREAVGFIENDRTRVIDASTAYRTADGWAYGFPEMTRTQRAAIKSAKRVSNPGCYPTGFIGLVRPLTDAGMLPASWPLSVNAVSGYSGGGRRMIEEFEDQASASFTKVPYRIYGLSLGHKHVAEMKAHGGLQHAPIFEPSVGRYAQGMIVEVPLPLYALPSAPKLRDLHAALAKAYEGERFVEVASLEEAASLTTLAPESLNGTNRMKLYVFGSDKLQQARLVALLDNLGKGASGAAMQNLNLMLGLDEAAGLTERFDWSVKGLEAAAS